MTKIEKLGMGVFQERGLRLKFNSAVYFLAMLHWSFFWTSLLGRSTPTVAPSPVPLAIG